MWADCATPLINVGRLADSYTESSHAFPMKIRIVKTPPAPKMDGFDLERFKLGKVYDVDSRLGQYLVMAGYARADAKGVDSDEQP